MGVGVLMSVQGIIYFFCLTRRFVPVPDAGRRGEAPVDGVEVVPPLGEVDDAGDGSLEEEKNKRFRGIF